MSQNRLKIGKNQAFLSVFEIKIQNNSVKKQKIPQVCVGTNDDFERNSKLHFTSVWYNISKGAF